MQKVEGFLRELGVAHMLIGLLKDGVTFKFKNSFGLFPSELSRFFASLSRARTSNFPKRRGSAVPYKNFLRHRNSIFQSQTADPDVRSYRSLSARRQS